MEKKIRSLTAALMTLTVAACGGDGATSAKLSTPEGALIVGLAAMGMVAAPTEDPTASTTSATSPTLATNSVLLSRMSESMNAAPQNADAVNCSDGGTYHDFTEARDVNSPYAPGEMFAISGRDYFDCREQDAATGWMTIFDGRMEGGSPATPSTTNAVHYWSVGTDLEPFSSALEFEDSTAYYLADIQMRMRGDAFSDDVSGEGQELVWADIRQVFDYLDKQSLQSVHSEVIFQLGSPDDPFQYDYLSDGTAYTGWINFGVQGQHLRECALGAVHVTTDDNDRFNHTAWEAPRGTLHLTAGAHTATVRFNGDDTYTVTVPGRAPVTYGWQDVNNMPICPFF